MIWKSKEGNSQSNIKAYLKIVLNGELDHIHSNQNINFIFKFIKDVSESGFLNYL